MLRLMDDDDTTMDDDHIARDPEAAPETLRLFEEHVRHLRGTYIRVLGKAGRVDGADLRPATGRAVGARRHRRPWRDLLLDLGRGPRRR